MADPPRNAITTSKLRALKNAIALLAGHKQSASWRQTEKAPLQCDGAIEQWEYGA